MRGNRRRRVWPILAAGLLAVALALGTLGCPPNEAVVCSTSTSNVGSTCSADYGLCAGGTDRIACKAATSGFSCDCVESGTTKKTFQSDNACDVSVDALKKRAMEGCGWKLDADDT